MSFPCPSGAQRNRSIGVLTAFAGPIAASIGLHRFTSTGRGFIAPAVMWQGSIGPVGVLTSVE
jgi:hypothetical protein